MLSLLPLAARGGADGRVLLTDSAKIHFDWSAADYDPSIRRNGAVIDSLRNRMMRLAADSALRVRRVAITAGASPEGTPEINCELSRRRAGVILDLMGSGGLLAGADTVFTFIGRDWEGVLARAVRSRDLPYRAETIRLLDEVVKYKRSTGREPFNGVARLMALHGGVPYNWLDANVFPEVRVARIVIDYTLDTEAAARLAARRDTIAPPPPSALPPVAETPQPAPDTVAPLPQRLCRPFFMNARTNMLFDLLALPNVGVEFHLGRNFSLGADWIYAWWSKNSSHKFWRAYGGELFARLWFGPAANRKPLTGHHIGLYGQAYIYDFEWGLNGEMGGRPGSTLWDDAMWGAGLEYGYSFPVARRLNIDLSIGVGYTGGKYYKYRAEDGHYVRRSTHMRRYFGPTRAEVSLVWLIGCDNFNRPKPEKGGAR